jgi:RNA polymerase sigma-70 factor (ECF subfamily)
VPPPNPPSQQSLSSQLAAHREHLLRLCYRMTGSRADAEDLVQETFRKALEHAPDAHERELRPWLTKVAMNASRDALRARQRRRYIGTWLPSPYETSDISAGDPEARYGELESVTSAFMLALEALTPNQRAVLLLRDVLDYSAQETSTALDISVANVKTTLHRARQAMHAYDAARCVPTAELKRKTRDALAALMLHLATGNDAALRALLSHDVRARNDGNGEFFAARRPVLGVDKVIRFHRNIMRLHQQRTDGVKRGIRQLLREQPRMVLRESNGLPALFCELRHSLKPGVPARSVVRVELDRDGKIALIDAVVASDKLRAIDFRGIAPLSALERGSLLLAALRVPPPRTWMKQALLELVRGTARWLRAHRAAPRHARVRAQSLNPSTPCLPIAHHA